MWTKQTFLFLMFALMGTVHAAQVAFQWGAVTYVSPIVYELGWGTTSGTYDKTADFTETNGRATQIPPNIEYFYSVRACTEDKTVCSPWAPELAFTVPPRPDIPAEFRVVRVIYWLAQ